MSKLIKAAKRSRTFEEFTEEIKKWGAFYIRNCPAIRDWKKPDYKRFYEDTKLGRI